VGIGVVKRLRARETSRPAVTATDFAPGSGSPGGRRARIEKGFSRQLATAPQQQAKQAARAEASCPITGAIAGLTSSQAGLQANDLTHQPGLDDLVDHLTHRDRRHSSLKTACGESSRGQKATHQDDREGAGIREIKVVNPIATAKSTP